MNAARIQSVLGFMSLTWLTGPIFGKELRVVSRRRRNYALRFAYIFALICFVVLNWGDLGGFSGGPSSGLIISRMSEAGIRFITTVVRFQFIVLQFLAVVLTSAAVYEEVQRRTLGMLMTTPITGWQFVTGKLLSKLLVIFGLLACSLPVLSVARLFGGVPWGYIISSLCITATATMLVGAISLYTSLRSKSLTSSFMMTLLIYGVFFCILPSILNQAGMDLIVIGAYVSPFCALRLNNLLLTSPSFLAGTLSFYWFGHCFFIMCLSALILAWASRSVRRLGLKSISQGNSVNSPRKNRSRPAMVALKGVSAALRRVNGSPLIWKELRFYTPGSRIKTILSATIAILVLVLSYIANLGAGVDFHDAQIFYMFFYFAVGVLVTTSLAGGTISDERQSRSLPLLLSLPVSDNYIIFTKALGVFYRASPMWLLLGVHMLIFTAMGFLHPIILLHVGMLVVWAVVFLTGAGLYFSSRFRSGTSAATMNVAMALALWLVLPLLARYRFTSGVEEMCLVANPFIQLVSVVIGASGAARGFGNHAGLEYSMAGETLGAGEISVLIMMSMLAYSLAGLLFAWRARRRLRTAQP
ncbi:MAG: hypothetical protein KAV00_04795 [Phycisphaerae bacterium]|nr:hypothetical protein [Phycisphaerae bacterium]